MAFAYFLQDGFLLAPRRARYDFLPPAAGSIPPRSRRQHRHEAVLSETITDLSSERLASLLKRIAEGDRGAFRRLYELQASRLHGVALRITRQTPAAADAVQETFVSVWQYAARFDPLRGSAEAWLTSIVRYRALDHARRGAREMTGVDVPEEEDTDPDPLARLAQASDGAALRRCLGELDAERRELIVRGFIDGLTHTELAARFTMPLGTVKSSIRRGLATLKRCLER